VWTQGAAIVAAVVLAANGAAMAQYGCGIDKNGDGKVDIVDIAVLMDHMPGVIPYPPAPYDPVWDLNCDGEIGVADLSALAAGVYAQESDIPVDPTVGISVRVDNLGSPAAGLTAYEVHLVAATADDRLVVFEGRFDGPMNQATGDLDSHFLLPDSDDTIDFIWRSEGSNWLGADNGLRAIIGLSNPLWQMDTAVARLVIPDGEVVVMTAMVACADMDATAISAVVPEPMSLALLAAGGLALLRRRR
jgi:hypothetical protein